MTYASQGLDLTARRAAVRRTAWSLALVAAAIFVAFVAYGMRA